jgi:aromatic ring-cleaving dioxygenase
MQNLDAPYHAHIYYTLEQKPAAEALRQSLMKLVDSTEIPQLSFVGAMRDKKVGPHPIPQFEIHFLESARAKIIPLLEKSGLTTLVHPLTDDDVADHTSLGHWIGKPLNLDLSTLDPPGKNQGIARFSKTDF